MSYKLINDLFSIGYLPFDFTFTFFKSGLGSRYSVEELFYQRNDLISRNEAYVGEHRFRIENAARDAFISCSTSIVHPLSLTRKASNAFQPIFFYDFDVMKKEKLIEESTRIKKGQNISPLHIHGVAMVPECSSDKMRCFVGENTLLNKINHKRIEGLFSTQIREISGEDALSGWLDYGNKYNFSNNRILLASSYESTYPDFFKRDAAKFIQDRKMELASREDDLIAFERLKSHQVIHVDSASHS